MKILFRANRIYRAFARTVKWMTASVTGIFLIAFLLIQIPFVQNYIGQKIIASVANDLDTKIKAENIAFNFHSAHIDDFVLYDQRGDTLLGSQDLQLNFELLPLLANKIHLGNIQIERPIVHLYVTEDSVNNWQFISDYFLSPSGKTHEANKRDKKADFTLTIKEVALQHLSFKMHDHIQNSILSYSNDSLLLDFDKIDLQNQEASFSHIRLVKPRFASKYAVNENSRNQNDRAWPLQIPWKIHAGQISISDAQIINQNKSETFTSGKFNSENLNITGLYSDFQDLYVFDDSLSILINHFRAADHSGLQIDSLNGLLKAGPQSIEWENALIQTPNSKLRENIHLSFSDQFPIKDPYNEIEFDILFKDAHLSKKDMALVPGLEQLFKEDIKLEGRLFGSLGNLHARDLHAHYGRVTNFNGNFTVMGLPDMDETFLDMSIDEFRTNYKEFSEILTFARIPENTRKLGTSTFRGNFTGFFSDFVAYGTLNTAIGSLKTDINMKIPKNAEPRYSGSMKISNFQAGYYLDDPNMGLLSFSGRVNGESFESNKLKAHLDGEVALLEYLGYAYKDIKIQGELEKRFLSGQLAIHDPNIDMTFDGTVDFKTEIPRFSARADIRNLNTKPLGLSSEKWKIRTKLQADLSGTNLDNLLGHIVLENTEAYARNNFYNLGTLRLTSEAYDIGKRMILNSKIADARLDGNFKISEVAPTFLSFLSNYYPSILNYQSASTSPQDFMFELAIKKSNNFTDLLLPDVKGLEGIHISGNFNSRYRRFFMTANVPRLKYQDIKVENLNLFARSNDDSLFFNSEIEDFEVNKLHSSQYLEGFVHSNQVILNLKAFENENANKLLANLLLTNKGDSLELHLLGSNIELAGKQWNINESNSLYYYNNKLYAENLKLESGNEFIQIENTIDSANRNNPGLEASLSNVDIQYWLSLAEISPYRISGFANGQIKITQPFEPHPKLRTDLLIDQFAVEDEKFKELTIQSDFDLESMQMVVNTEVVAQEGVMRSGGKISLKDEALDLDISANGAPFRLLEPFLTGILTNMGGEINGSGHLGGTIDNPELKGELTINNAIATLDYLNADYYFDPIKIELSNQSLIIKESKFYDTYNKDASSALIGGEIYFENLSELEFRDFYIYTDRHFKIMQTTEKDNDYFYGTGYGKAIVLINGPVNFLNIYINAVTDEGTSVAIPIQYESGVSQYQFVRFVNHSAPANPEENLNEEPLPVWLVNFTMDLDITPAAEIQLIFDEKAGDIIKGRGEGSLKLNFNSEFDFEMYGGVTITEGEYLFTLENIINKKFELEPGGTITWSGDPYEANLNLIAKYTKKVSAYELVSDLADQLSTTELQTAKKPTPFTVLLHMQGPLDSPEIRFDIQAENQQELGNILTARLQEIRNDENELNKQVFGLIVFNSFLPSEFSASGGGSLVSSGVGTVTEFLSNQLSLYFNDWLSQYDFEVDFQYRNYEIGSNGEVPGVFRNALELELSKKIGRLAINVGGNFDFGNTNNSVASTNNLAGDFSIEYSLTEDGRVRVRAFRNSEYDLFSDAYRNKGGVGLYYKKEFNSFKDLFQANPNNNQKQADLQGKE